MDLLAFGGKKKKEAERGKDAKRKATGSSITGTHHHPKKEKVHRGSGKNHLPREKASIAPFPRKESNVEEKRDTQSARLSWALLLVSPAREKKKQVIK